MKEYLSTAFAIVCVMLVASLILIKRNDNTQHQTDVGTIADFSNRLDMAQTQIAICNGTILTLSNNLNQSQSASLTFSNQWAEAQSAVMIASGQLTNLNQHLAELETENQALGGHVMELTNQTMNLMKQNALTEASLEQANKDYALLENRLRRDVAERILVERKFNNLTELQAQMQNLKQNPVQEISPGSIYAGLGIEVSSNGSLHVISPN